jgi:hypothetical protein
MDGSKYSQLVHSGLEMATILLGAKIADTKAETLVPLVL